MTFFLRQCRAALAVLMCVVVGASVSEAQIATVSGPDSLIIYNSERQPVRRIGNLPKITACSILPSGQLVLLNHQFPSFVFAGPQGDKAEIIETTTHVWRATADDAGFVLVLANGLVGDFGLDGVPKKWLGNITAHNAMRHPNEGVLIVTRTGEVQHVSWEGKPISKFASDTAGREVSIIDIAFENPTTLIAFDSKNNETVVLDLSLKEVRRSPAPFEIKETAFVQSANSSVAAVANGQKTIRFVRSDGSVSTVSTKASVSCLSPLSGGEFAVGYSTGDVVYIPSGMYANYDGLVPSLTYDSLAAIIVYAIVASLFVAWIWKAVLRYFKWYREPAPSPDMVERVVERPAWRGPKILSVAIFLASFYGLYLSFEVYPSFKYSGAWDIWGRYYAGAALAAVCLLILAWQGGLYARVSVPKAPGSALSGNRVSWVLMALSLGSAFYLNYLNQNWIASKWILFTWISAQILFVLAFSSSAPKPRWLTSQKIQFFLLLVATVFSRVYRWTECPPDIHFDFGAFGHEAVKVLVEDWYPLFDLRAGQTLGRPWLLQTAAVLWLFDLGDWVIRIPSLIWSVGLVWACYLLGREVVSHRFGLIFGILVAAQHTLLGYSRLPYVTESSAPFVFALYYVARGLNRHAMRDWALAGVWAAWSMMTVRQFTTFPFIGAAIFAFCAIVHWRAMWRHSVHIGVMGIAALITFSPYYNFYTQGQHLAYRLAGTSPLFRGGSLSTDFNLWYHQFSAAFGGILRFPDRAAWSVETIAPTCLAVTGSLFGAGLIFLLVRWRSWASAFSLFPMAVSIALGSAFLANPPSYYHQFIGIIFVMFVCAVPVEGYFDAVSRLRWRLLRWPLALALTAGVGYCVREQVQPLISFCAVPLTKDGIPAEKISFYSLFSKYMIAHRNDRFISISFGDPNYNFHHPNTAEYYGQFSERHDIRSPIRPYLPLRPTSKPQGLQFMMIQGYHDELKKVQEIYPVGTIERFRYNHGLCELVIYSVSAAEAQAAYDKAVRDGRAVDKEYFTLQPT